MGRPPKQIIPCAFWYIWFSVPESQQFTFYEAKAKMFQNILFHKVHAQIKNEIKMKKKLKTKKSRYKMMKKEISSVKVHNIHVFWARVHILLESREEKEKLPLRSDLPSLTGHTLTQACKGGGDPQQCQPPNGWAVPVAGRGRCCITWRSWF